MLLQQGQTVAPFYPFNRVGASVNLLCRPKQDVQGDMPFPGPLIWKQGVRADYSGLSEGGKQSFIALPQEYGDLFATGDAKLGREAPGVALSYWPKTMVIGTACVEITEGSMQ